MSHSLDHLHTGVGSFLDESFEDRISRLYVPKWVSYERGNEALARMEHLLHHPPSGRMPCMLLYGDSDIGQRMYSIRFSIIDCLYITLHYRHGTSFQMQ